MTAKTLISAAAAFSKVATVALFGAASAQAYSDGAAFDRVAKSHGASAQFKWHNALAPEASGDYVAVAQSEPADAALNRLAQSYSRPEAKWINAMLPAASADYVMVAEGTSADTKFMRQVAFYTRDMLDRGGWVNAFIADDHYAAGNVLFAAAVGEGVTSYVPV
jgi:hypothetical protein